MRGQAPIVALPHSSESERAVLAGILLRGGELLERAAAALVVDDFYLEAHRLIYAAMLELSGAAIDLRTVQAALEAQGALARVGGLAYLAGLDVDLPDLASWDSYLDVVRDRSMRRELIATGERIAREAQDGSGVDGLEALTRGELALRQLTERALPKASVTVGEVLDRVLAELEASDDRGMVGISTGYPDVDHVIHGLRRGNLIFLGGMQGSGKTSFAMNVATNLAKAGHTVGIFSLEMTSDELTLRLWAAEADVSHSRMLEGYLSSHQWQKLIHTVKRVSPLPIHIDDSSALHLPQICARARRWRAEQNVELIVVDHLQLMVAGARHSNRNEELAACSRTLKELAKELGIPILVLSQLNRAPERRGGDHRPQLSDLRDSGAPAADGDLVAFLYRDELYNPDDPSVRGVAEFIVRKNRHGATGTVPLVFIGETFSFKSQAREWQRTSAPPPRVTSEPEPSAIAGDEDPF